MILCEQCPTNPACRNCLDQLRAGDAGQKVIPPRRIWLTQLATGQRMQAELRAVSRLAIGVFVEETDLAGRYEAELAADFRIIGGAVRGIREVPYFVLDIEKVLRKEDVLDRLLLEEFRSWNTSREPEPSVIHDSFHDRDEERNEWVKQELRKLSILRQIEDIYLYLLEEEQIRPLGHARVDKSVELEAKVLAMRAVSADSRVREQIVSDGGKQFFDIYACPLPDKTCGIVLINITEAIAAERERQRKEWELYKQVLATVTQEKLMLLRDEELFLLVRGGETSFAVTVKAPEDLAFLRSRLKEGLLTAGMPQKSLHLFTVAVSEAASNTLKHGTGGTVSLYVYPSEGVCRVVVYDQGQGIMLEDLPRAALQQGYSTRYSLGAGFHVMLQICDRLWISSSETGTKMVLEKSLFE
jgi:anti-sigma regulatory factor (Ser/Thr protein kinase)